MIEQYLSNKNESATITKSEFFFETKQGKYAVGALMHVCG